MKVTVSIAKVLHRRLERWRLTLSPDAETRDKLAKIYLEEVIQRLAAGAGLVAEGFVD